MRSARIALVTLLMLAFAGAAAAPPAAAHVSVGVAVDVGLFFDYLAPYGRWVSVSPWGWAWVPTRVSYGWRPYHDGQWSYCDDGWLWLSNEPWGWIVYHYGRWTFDPYHGWIWIPGSEWAPSWVAWRWGGGVVGWAPLPPERGMLRVGVSLPAVSLAYRLPVQHFVYVGERDLLAPRVGRHAHPVSRNASLMRVTSDQTRYVLSRGRVVNRGIPVDRVEQALGKRVLRQRLVDLDRPAAPRRLRDGYQVFRKEVRPAPAHRRPPGVHEERESSRRLERPESKPTRRPPAVVNRKAGAPPAPHGQARVERPRTPVPTRTVAPPAAAKRVVSPATRPTPAPQGDARQQKTKQRRPPAKDRQHPQGPPPGW